MGFKNHFFSKAKGWAQLTLLFIFSNFWTTQSAFSQTDTHFWFVAPEVSSNHSDRPIAFRLTSESTATTVRIYTPADPTIFDTTLLLGANATTTIPLTHRIGLIENNPANTIHNKGFLIESSALITAYYEVISAGNNPDIFALKGRNALGLDFYIPGQNTMGNSNNRGHERIDIVATEDNTTITLVNTATLFRNTGGNIPPGTVNTITLNRGQTYSFRTNSRNANISQAGSRVTADKPIAITYIDDSVLGGTFFGGGCYDLLGDQLIPVDLLGNEYIVMRGFLNDVPSGSGNYRELVLITAVEDSSPLFINGGTSIANLMRGETYTHLLNDSSVFIQSTRPILVAHISGFGCETGLAVLPSIVCTGSRQVGFTRTTTEFFGINLMTKSANVGGFLWNGGPVVNANQFQDVPGTNGVWKFTRISFNTTQIPINTGNLITNNLGPFHMGIINGGSNTGCRYGYFSDFARYTVTGSTNSPPGAPLCEGSRLELYADSIPDASYVWTNPAGFPFSSLRNPSISAFGATDTGAYVVFAIVDGCNSAPDTVWVSMRPLPADPNASNNGPYCIGDSIQLNADSLPGVQYSWTGPNGFSSNQINPFVALASFADTGTYTLSLTLNGCASATHPTQVTVYNHPPVPVAGLATDSLCPGEAAHFLADSVAGAVYEWSGPASFVAQQRNPVLMSVTQANAGWYYLRLRIAGCESALDSVHLAVVPGPIQVSISSGDSNSCFGTTTVLEVDSVPGYQYQWLRNDTLIPGANTRSYAAQSSGSYRVSASTQQGCRDTSAVLPLVFRQLPSASIISAMGNSFCTGDSLLLRAQGNSSYLYQWMRNGQTLALAHADTLWASLPGSYQLMVTDTNQCATIIGPLNIQQFPLPSSTVTSNGPTSFCQGDSLLLSAQAQSDIQYRWYRNGILLPDTSHQLSVNLPGNYRLHTTNALGCTDSSVQTTVTVHPLPTSSIQPTGNIRLCTGDTLVLQGTPGPYTYQWLANGLPIPGAIQSQYVVLGNGNYQLVTRSAAGCSDTSALSVVQLSPPPSVQISNDNPLQACPGDSVRLRINPFNPAYSYTWLRNGSPLGQNSERIQVRQSGLYSVVATDTNGCSSQSNSLQVLIQTLPNAHLAALGPFEICAGSDVELMVQPGLNNTYQWYRDGVPIAGATQFNVLVATTGNYHCRVENPGGCADESAVVRVEVLPLPPQPRPSSNGPLCAGADLLLESPSHAGIQYAWTGPLGFTASQSNPIRTNVRQEHSGWYYLQLFDNGCPGPMDSVFVVIEPPLPSIDVEGRRRLCTGYPLRFEATEVPGATYLWALPNGDTRAGASIEIDPLQLSDAGEYVLLVQRGSCSSDPIRVLADVNDFVFLFPTAFTPNGDGLNDNFFPVTFYTGNYDLRIFDRWGQRVFRTTDPQGQWDGRIHGEYAQPGSYNWVLQFDGCRGSTEVLTGGFMLIR